MNLKRIITGLIGFPIVTIIFAFGNKFIMDIIFAVIAMIAMYEYQKCVSVKSKTINWISYVTVLFIAFIHVIPKQIFNNIVFLSLPILLLVLFLHIIISNMKINFENIAYTLFGIIYITAFIAFLPMIYGLDKSISGKVLIWFVIFSSWGTDVFAYFIGCKFGKTKFSKVSHKKSIEGCIGGTIGSVLLNLLFVYILNKFGGFELSYYTIGIICFILSILGQIGDFSASCIKRYFEVKDFSELFPGHGGMIDRIDSVMFIAPFAYLLFTTFI